MGFREHPIPTTASMGDSLNGGLCKTGPGVLDQAYHVTACSLEEMLNLVNLPFFQLMPHRIFHVNIHLQCYTVI